MTAEKIFLYLVAVAAIVGFILLWRYLDSHTCQLTSHCTQQFWGYRVKQR